MMRTARSHRWLAAIFVLCSACGFEGGDFHHDVDSTTKPWTHEGFDDVPGRTTFAVFSDLNGGEREGVFSAAAGQLAILRPELVLSVGDLIEGASDSRADLVREWESFDERASLIPAPVFRVGGNHDLGSRARRRVWAERYGPQYYHFVYEDVLFLVLDTEDQRDTHLGEMLRAGSAGIRSLAGLEHAVTPRDDRPGNVSRAQSEYFRRVLKDHPDVRWTMLFMHKPVWDGDQDPDYAAIEAALASRPYTVFNGHLHSMSHATKNGRDHITLGTTGGFIIRHDPMSFDHVTLVSLSDEEPAIVHLRLEGASPSK